MTTQDSPSSGVESDEPVGESTVDADRYASTGQRATASLLDTGVVVPLVLHLTRRWGTLRRIAAFFVGGAVGAGTYHVVLEGRGRQTPGKRVTGIAVVGADGEPCGYLAAAVRTVARVVDFLPVGYLLEAIGIRITSKNQRAGDLAAGTVVVKTGNENADENGTSNGGERRHRNESENQD